MSLKIIIIRHAEKEFSNNKGPINSYQHDSPIKKSKTHLFNITNKSNILIEKYGIPEICITSPYLRCRETLLCLLDKGPFEIDNLPKIYVEPLLSEFLGNQELYYINMVKSSIPRVEPYTKKFNLPPIKEKFEDMEARSEYAIEKLFKASEKRKKIFDNFSEMYEILRDNENLVQKRDTIIWVVTHGIIISSIYKALKKYDMTENKRNIWYESPDYLQGICISKEFGKMASFEKI